MPPQPPPPLHRHARAAVAALLGAALLCFAACAILAWGHLVSNARVTREDLAAAQRDIVDTAQRIDRVMAGVAPVAAGLADALSSGAMAPAQIPGRLRDTLGASANVDQLAVAFDRATSGSQRRLYAPVVRRMPDGALRSAQIEDAYDYTQFGHRWFADPILDGPQWNAPGVLDAGAPLVATFAAPFFRPGANSDIEPPLGLVLAGVDLARATRELDALDLGTSGYAFVITREGHFVRHPRRDLIDGRQTVFDVALAAHDTALHSVGVRATRGESGLVASAEGTTGQATWIVYQSIPSTGWTLAAVLFQEEFLPESNRLRHEWFQIISAALAGLMFLSLAAGPFVMTRGTNHLAWALSISTAVALAAGIGALWAAFDRYPPDDAAGVAVHDQGAVEQFLDTFVETAGGPASQERLRIPTGVYVRSIEFLGAANVFVTGEIWQRVSHAQGNVAPGFRLVEAEEPTFTAVPGVGDGNLRAWSFSAKLRQGFSYERYPFDRQEVWVRLEPAPWLRDAVLVPDFGSYQLTNPLAKPGVGSDLVLPGWEVRSAFFDYRVQRYNTDFGRAAAAEVPHLYYNVSLRRQFIGPFISNLLPVVVTAAMLFGMVLITTKKDGQVFKAMDVVRGTAALFVVASFQHIALRNALTSPHVFYFEYFYFTLYLAILAVTLNGILFAVSNGTSVIDYRDNLVPKLFFWPLLLVVLFITTCWVLY